MKRQNAILLACSAAFFWSQMSRAMIYSAMPAAAGDLGLSPGQAGLITGAVFAGYVLAVWASGFLPLGRRAAVLVSLAVSVAAELGFAFARGPVDMLVLGALVGAGVGVYLPRGMAVISEQFAIGERGRAMGVHEMAAHAGLMLGPLFMGAVLTVAPWRWGVALAALAGLAATLAFWRYVPDAPAPSRQTGGRAHLPLDYRVAGLAVMGGANFIIIAGFAAALPQLVHLGWGVAPAAAASFAGYTRVGGIVGSALGGAMADRLGRVRSLAVGYVVSLAGVAGMALLNYGPLFGILLVVMTAAASAGSTAYYALAGDSFRAGERERVFGIISSSASLMGVVLPPVAIGYMLEYLPGRSVVAAVALAPLIGLAAAAWFTAAGRRTPGKVETHAG